MVVAPLGICWAAALAFAALDGRRKRIGWAASIVLAIAWFISIWLTWDVVQHGPRTMVAGNWEPGIGIVLRLDALGALFATLSLGVLLAALLFEVFGGVRSRSFPALVLFLATGLCGLFLTADIFNFYVFFEISMIAAYVLVGYGEEKRNFRASAIFAIVNLLGSVFFLIGIAAIYHLTGRLDMDAVARRATIAGQAPALLAATIIFVAFSIKLGLFPFHFWLASVYTGTRPAVAAILSGALANIGSYGLIRFGGGLLPRELESATPVLLVIGSLSILYGGVQAISRRSISQVLAYSSIGQVGYILLALAIGPKVGFSAVILISVLNALNKTLLFLSENLRGRLVGMAFVIGAFSVAGIPPTAGFLSKAALIKGAIDAKYAWIVVLVVVGGFLSVFYMMQIYQRTFWIPESEEEAHHPPSPLDRRMLVALLALLILAIGIWPQPLLALSDHAAAALTGGGR
jgi:multicomponent Na+:H+ antiporter subunit D